MNNDRTITKIFNAKPDGVRRVGRPKLRWKDGVDQDMGMLEVKKWKRVALNREEWTKILKRRPGPTMDCRANDDDDGSFLICRAKQALI